MREPESRPDRNEPDLAWAARSTAAGVAGWSKGGSGFAALATRGTGSARGETAFRGARSAAVPRDTSTPKPRQQTKAFSCTDSCNDLCVSRRR